MCDFEERSVSKNVRLCALEEISDGQMHRVSIDGIDVMVTSVDGCVYAVEDRCGHMSAPLSLGTLEGTYVECPLHRAKFEITNGKVIGDPVINLPPDAANVRVRSFAMTRTYPVRAFPVDERDGELFINLSGPEGETA